jgi:hypothetical protein
MVLRDASANRRGNDGATAQHAEGTTGQCAASCTTKSARQHASLLTVLILTGHEGAKSGAREGADASSRAA